MSRSLAQCVRESSRSRRDFSTSCPACLYRPHLPNRSPRGAPKRDQTFYGIADPRVPPTGWQRSDVAAAHPLWQFFHNKDPLPQPDSTTQHGGRAWLEEELRRKSFQHLHQLWFILIKERGVLLCQRHEAQKVHLDLNRTFIKERLRKVSKSLGRIKAVLSERRAAVMQARNILQTETLVARYPALAQFDEHSHVILQRQQWRWRLGHLTASSGPPRPFEAPPSTTDGTWEWVAPNKTPPVLVDEPQTPKAFLARAMRHRVAAEKQYAMSRKVERNMANQALRLSKLLLVRSKQIAIPPYLAKYKAAVVADAVQAGLPAVDVLDLPVTRQPTHNLSKTKTLVADYSRTQQAHTAPPEAGSYLTR